MIPKDSDTDETKRRKQKARSKRYGIEVLEGEGERLSFPPGWPNALEDYGDPVNLKYPMRGKGRALNSRVRFKQFGDRYKHESSKKIVHTRIVERLLSLGINVTRKEGDKLDDLLPSRLKDKIPVVKQDSFKPPVSVANQAKLGLELRREFGRGGTEVGVARARDLANRKGISLDTIGRMVSYFARHAVDAEAKGSESRGFWKKPSNPSAGWIAWLLWGGDSGRRWCNSIWRKERKALVDSIYVDKSFGSDSGAILERAREIQLLVDSHKDLSGWCSLVRLSKSSAIVQDQVCGRFYSISLSCNEGKFRLGKAVEVVQTFSEASSLVQKKDSDFFYVESEAPQETKAVEWNSILL